MKNILFEWSPSIDVTGDSLRTEKTILPCQDAEGNAYLLKGEVQDRQEVERICAFTNQLNLVIPTPFYEKMDSSHYTVERNHVVYTLERKLIGEEIEEVSDTHLTEIATALGTMHRFSLKNQLQLNRGTTWSLFGGNASEELGDYDENEVSFWECRDAFSEHPLFREVEAAYHHIRQDLQNIWSELPLAATQGDFCYYNMVFENDKLTGLFDFNLAGDEVLINECLAVAVYHSWHAPYQGILSPEERFTLFCDAYQRIRPWTEKESSVVPQLKALIRAFRYDRIEAGIKANQPDVFLKETLQLLREADTH
ncbi:phosphotransferase enzyme family protein [Chryseomicrobium palamuruense]|uniref:Phosphotransferase enzyme family protein n=1 Tax=Chryseomicrobium palamuruense TaxID=682973 RepID=A0ABV8UYK0_9BACL